MLTGWVDPSSVSVDLVVMLIMICLDACCFWRQGMPKAGITPSDLVVVVAALYWCCVGRRE